jgi:hypothetical protein
MSISGNQTAQAKAQNDVLKKFLNAPAISSPPRPFRAPHAGNDGSGTDALCQSLAGRIVTALCGGSNVVLVIGNSLPSPLVLSQALNHAVAWWYAPIVIACRPELSRDELLSVAPPQPAMSEESDSAAERGEAAPAPLPLYVFGDADRLSDAQIQNIYESLAARYRTSAAGVFLARPDFLTRLQRSDAGLLKEGKTTQITLQEFRREEQPRPNEGPAPADTIASRSYRRATWRLSIGALLCLAVCGFIFGLPDFAAWTQSESGLLARPVPTDRAAQEGELSAPSAKMQTSSSMAGAAASAETPERKRVAALAAPVERRLSAAEIAALVARGDAFVGMRDLVSARLFYALAVEAGDRGAALRMGATFDPAFLDRAGIRGEPGNQPEALSWYRRAGDFGDATAEHLLSNLEAH